MTVPNCSVSKFRLIFEGQSLNNVPSPSSGNSYPQQMMATRPIPYDNVAIGDQPWNNLAFSVATRLYPWALKAEKGLLIMCGGTSNIWSGETGADLYTEEVAYAAAARAAGFWKVMIMTLCPNSTNTGPQETQRSSHNTLLIADASHGFDAVVDIASDSRLSDPTSSTYYVQGGFTSGVHWTAAGAAVAASLVGPAADAVLATG